MRNQMSAVLLLASLAAAQSNPKSARPLAGGQQASPTPEIVVTAHQRYSALRRGREQEIEIEICNPADALPNTPLCLSMRPQADNLVPLALEINAEPGLAIGYRQGSEYRALSRGTPLKIGNKRGFLARLRAADNAALGLHWLAARLKVLQGDQGPGGAWAGNGIVKEVVVKFPLMIVKHDAQVAEADGWPLKQSERARIARISKDVFTLIGTVTLARAQCLFGDCDGLYPMAVGTGGSADVVP